MNKILTVKKPFFVMETGDTFQYSQERGMYVSEYDSQNDYTDADGNGNIRSRYNSKYEISKEFADTLISEGFLENAPVQKETHVNVFDEIDSLISTYTAELDRLDDEMRDAPQCLVVEKETVLNNLIKVLDHLKNLKK